ncbi:MAG: MerR family transcriptional regulator [Alphaproteobacteria bacterium]|nr:MerR family transcriptional regulator [Alphaproteobacteria bacterium]
MKHLDRHAERRLPELVQAATELIDQAGLSAEDERVALHPDARVVRYYQSLGLVERPSRYEGRAAIYGWRHLVQVVAVKLLQSQGYTLSRVQEAFAGLPFERLEAVVLRALGERGAPLPVQRPALPQADGSFAAGALIELPLSPAPPAPPAPRALIAVELRPGVRLSIDPALVADPDALVRRLSDALASLPPTKKES